MGLMKEFKEFAIKGNVMDMAVGVIIGGAFGKIVNSMVNDVLMPPLGKLVGNLNFNDNFWNLAPDQAVTSLAEAKSKGVPVLAYGAFLSQIIDFAILAFCIFLMMKGINRLKQPAQTPKKGPTQKDCPYCLQSIPMFATRCAHCTSDVEIPKDAAPTTR